MATFKVSDVMERKVDGVITGYTVVIDCEGSGGARVSNSIFVTPKELPIASKTSIISIAEAWLKETEGVTTRAEVMAQKVLPISDSQVKELIPTTELNVLVGGK